MWHPIHSGATVMTGFILRPLATMAPASRRHRPRGRTWTHTGSLGAIQVRMLLSFQRPPRVPMEGTPPSDLRYSEQPRRLADRTRQYSAPREPIERGSGQRRRDQRSAQYRQVARTERLTGRKTPAEWGCCAAAKRTPGPLAATPPAQSDSARATPPCASDEIPACRPAGPPRRAAPPPRRGRRLTAPRRRA